MKVAHISFEKKWNLGDYNHEMIGALGLVEENEDPSAALKDLIVFVRTRGEESPSATSKVEPKSEPKQETTKETKAEKKTKKSAATKEEAQDGEKESSQEQAGEKSSESENTEKKKVKGKATQYNPEEPVHKKLLGEILDKSAPNWKQNTPPYKEAAHLMKGEDFLDAEGIVLETFKTTFLSKVKL